jgi:hypothetical protein
MSCLVLKIDEHCSQNGIIDTTIYIIHNQRNNQYFIYGKRANTPTAPAIPYAFTCITIDHVTMFIEFAMWKNNAFSYTMYNLPIRRIDTVSFELINQYATSGREVACYENAQYDHDELTRYIQIMSIVYNNDNANLRVVDESIVSDM